MFYHLFTVILIKFDKAINKKFYILYNKINLIYY